MLGVSGFSRKCFEGLGKAVHLYRAMGIASLVKHTERHFSNVLFAVPTGISLAVRRNDGGLLSQANRPLHELKPLVFLVRTRSHPSGINVRLLTTDLVSGCRDALY